MPYNCLLWTDQRSRASQSGRGSGNQIPEWSVQTWLKRSSPDHVGYLGHGVPATRSVVCAHVAQRVQAKSAISVLGFRQWDYRAVCAAEPKGSRSRPDRLLGDRVTLWSVRTGRNFQSPPSRFPVSLPSLPLSSSPTAASLSRRCPAAALIIVPPSRSRPRRLPFSLPLAAVIFGATWLFLGCLPRRTPSKRPIDILLVACNPVPPHAVRPLSHPLSRVHVRCPPRTSSVPCPTSSVQRPRRPFCAHVIRLASHVIRSASTSSVQHPRHPFSTHVTRLAPHVAHSVPTSSAQHPRHPFSTHVTHIVHLAPYFLRIASHLLRLAALPSVSR
ncbi:hypothetical protein BDN72DRAFT_907350 [Pluteus cervinus]|uniref:Uncharacterized protein n=1 Tax=Pluteus cervinus TaxID=181527 RepID=A0ACD2ZWY3_9AGAR|nr:hypothetical protein BDN72DRAFT_907350 [Pluteus cervinus]